MASSTLMRSAPASHNCSIILSFGLALLTNYQPLPGLALVGSSGIGARKKLVWHNPNFLPTLMPVLSFYLS